MRNLIDFFGWLSSTLFVAFLLSRGFNFLQISLEGLVLLGVQLCMSLAGGSLAYLAFVRVTARNGAELTGSGRETNIACGRPRWLPTGKGFGSPAAEF